MEWNENGTLRNRALTEQGKKRNATQQTYGTGMVIKECNILLRNLAPERDIVKLISIIILNERS